MNELNEMTDFEIEHITQETFALAQWGWPQHKQEIQRCGGNAYLDVVVLYGLGEPYEDDQGFVPFESRDDCAMLHPVLLERELWTRYRMTLLHTMYPDSYTDPARLEDEMALDCWQFSGTEVDRLMRATSAQQYQALLTVSRAHPVVVDES